MGNERGYGSGCLSVIGLLVSVVYLSNISMGIIEIPDNLPFVGNLDEVFFSGVLFASLARLGINLPVGQRRIVVKADEGNTTDENSRTN